MSCNNDMLILPTSVRACNQFFDFIFNITAITYTAGSSFTTSESFLKYDRYT